VVVDYLHKAHAEDSKCQNLALQL